MVMSAKKAAALGLKPLARLVTWAVAGVEPASVAYVEGHGTGTKVAADFARLKARADHLARLLGLRLKDRREELFELIGRVTERTKGGLMLSKMSPDTINASGRRSTSCPSNHSRKRPCSASRSKPWNCWPRCQSAVWMNRSAMKRCK